MKTRVLQVDPARPDPAAIEEAAELIRAGRLVAFPTETVYGLGANAQTLLSGHYLGTIGRPTNYLLSADVNADGSIAVSLHETSPWQVTAGLVVGTGTTDSKRRVRIDFETLGYMKGHAKRDQRRMVGRIVLREGERMRTRRFVLGWQEPPHGVGVTMVSYTGFIGHYNAFQDGRPDLQVVFGPSSPPPPQIENTGE